MKVLEPGRSHVGSIWSQISRRCSPWLVLLLALPVVVLLALFVRELTPPPSVPSPKNLDRLDPQLRAYVVEKVAWANAAPREARRHAVLGMVYAANGLWAEARICFQNTADL